MMNNSEEGMIDAAKQHILKNPTQLVSCIKNNEHLIWIKRRPFSKKTVWHKLQRILTYFIPHSIFSPTVTSSGPESLKQEAARLRLFAAKNLAVPNVLAETAEFIILSDAGVQLDKHIQSLSDTNEKHQFFHQAAFTLNNLHRANLCHGRPSFRDMTLLDNIIFFIDLEENSLEVMSLAQAQARDVWLFFNSAARHSQQDFSLLINLFETYNQHVSPETIKALKKMVLILKPLRFLVENLLMPIVGRDVRHAVVANKALEKALL